MDVKLGCTSSVTVGLVDTVAGARAIVAVSTATITEAARYPVGDAVYPGEVAATGDRLWFGYDAEQTSDGLGDFGYLDLATSAVQLHDSDADSSRALYSGPPRLAVNPARPGLLVAADVNSTTAWIGVYDVSTGSGTLTGKHLASSSSKTRDIAFTSDGSELIRADVASRQSIDVDSLAVTDVYSGVYQTYAMASSTDGRIALATDQGVEVHAKSSPATSLNVSLPAVNGFRTPSAVNRHGLALEPGGDRLFAVIDGFYLLVLNDPTTTVPTTTASATPAIKLNQPTFYYARPGIPFTITGTATGFAPAVKLTVTRVDSEDPAGKVITTLMPDGFGAFSFTDTLLVEGSAKYTVTYPGTGNWDSVSASLTIYAAKLSVTLSLSGNGKVYAYGTTVTFTAWLRKWSTNRVVEIWADPAGSDLPKRLLKKGAVDSAGKLSVSLKLTRNTVLTTSYAGDDVYGASVGQATVYTQVAVNTKITKHFKTKKIGSKTYYVVRTTKDPHFITTMTYYPDRFYRLVIQKHSGGTWKAFKTASFDLNTKGTSETWITGYYAAGLRFRVRAEYGTSAYSDKVNAKTYGTWRYYTYAK